MTKCIHSSLRYLTRAEIEAEVARVVGVLKPQGSTSAPPRIRSRVMFQPNKNW